jgi:hypothetical protein
MEDKGSGHQKTRNTVSCETMIVVFFFRARTRAAHRPSDHGIRRPGLAASSFAARSRHDRSPTRIALLDAIRHPA